MVQTKGNDLIALTTGGVIKTAEVQVDDQYLKESPASVLAAYLIEVAGFFTRPNSGGYPLFVSYLPDIKEEAGAVFDSPGELEQKSMRGGHSEKFAVQIRLKGWDYENTRNKLSAVVNNLDDLYNITINSGEYSFTLQNANRTSAITPIGRDEDRKYDFTVNYLLTLKEN